MKVVTPADVQQDGPTPNRFSVQRAMKRASSEAEQTHVYRRPHIRGGKRAGQGDGQQAKIERWLS